MVICRSIPNGLVTSIPKVQSRGVLLIWIGVGQGPTTLAVGAGGACLDIFFSLDYHFSFLSPSLGRRPDID